MTNLVKTGPYNSRGEVLREGVPLVEERGSRLAALDAAIARDNPLRAVRFVEELVERCERLADAPRGFPPVPRFENAGIRRRVYGAYLIFYRIDDVAGSIEVLDILHGARDIEIILFSAG